MADELERSAGRAQARGGAAAARGVPPARRGTHRRSGAARRAGAGCRPGQPPGGGVRRRARPAWRRPRRDRSTTSNGRGSNLVRAQVAFASGFGSDAPPLLLTAARGLEPFDLDLARETYLAAWGAAEMAGSALGPGVLLEICRAVQALPPPTGDPRPLELLLEGLALLITDGHAGGRGHPATRRRRAHRLSLDDVLRWGWMATFASTPGVGHRELPRDLGATRAARSRRGRGRATAAAPLAAGAPEHVDRRPRRGRVARGRERERRRRRPAAASRRTRCCGCGRCRAGRPSSWTCWRLRPSTPPAKGQGIVTSRTLGCSRPVQRARPLRGGGGRGSRERPPTPSPDGPSMWALPELVEAARALRGHELAREALARLTSTTQPCDTDFARGIEARCRALLSRRRGGRRAVPRSDRPTQPHAAPSGSGPGPSAVRRVAAAGGPARRRPTAAADRPRSALARWAWTRSPSAPVAS